MFRLWRRGSGGGEEKKGVRDNKGGMATTECMKGPFFNLVF